MSPGSCMARAPHALRHCHPYPTRAQCNRATRRGLHERQEHAQSSTHHAAAVGGALHRVAAQALHCHRPQRVGTEKAWLQWQAARTCANERARGLVTSI